MRRSILAVTTALQIAFVSLSEAHDSGLCAATPETRRRFATDLLNLTLASPEVNRGQKNDRDAAAWVIATNAGLPTEWFASARNTA